jgi:hypothetical protein
MSESRTVAINGAIIMSRMLAVRYVTLAALVTWLGGMVALALLTSPPAEVLAQFHTAGLACGAIAVVGLMVLKFVGPPPRDFVPRIGLLVVMLLVTLYFGTRSRTSLLVDIVLGSALLSWYAKE